MGYFIATYLDGQKIFNKLSESPNGQIPEDSDIWKIIRKYKSETFDVKNPFSYKINMRLPSIHGPFNPKNQMKVVKMNT